MKKENRLNAEILRQKAEELLKKKLPNMILNVSEDEALKLIYELEVHQIELEMQNEELIRVKEMATELAIEKYTELFDFAPLGYFILSKQGIIIDINLSGSEMLGNERARLKNFSFETFISRESKPIFNSFLKEVFNNNAKKTCEITLTTTDDLALDVHLTGILNTNGDRCFMSGVDITERRRIERLHRESESFLKETQLIAQLGTYTMDIPSGRWVSSEVLDQVFGIDSDYDKSVEGWASIVHPDWQNTMKEYFSRDVIGNKTTFDKEYKIIRKNDNAERWVHGIGRLKFNANNEPIKMVGTIRDITERKQAEESIKRFQLFLMSSLDSQKDTILLSLDKNCHYLYYNKAHFDAMKQAYNKVIKVGMNILECITSEVDRKSFKEYFNRALKGESISNVHKSGDVQNAWYESYFYPIVNENNEIIGVTSWSRNITERKHAEAELEKWANIFKPKAN